MSSQVDYSVVVPVYNSSRSVVELVEGLMRTMAERRASCEILLVDDASPDPESWRTLVALADSHEFVRAFRLRRNFGKQAALICGFEHARGEFIITMDDDLQHDPADVPKLMEMQAHDVVVARFRKKRHGLFKRVTSLLRGWFDHKLIGKPRELQMSPFKLFRADVVRDMLRIRTAYPFIPALIFYVTRDVVNVELTHQERRYGRTTFTVVKMVRLFSYLLINNSSFLLRVVAVLGMLMSLASTGLGIFFLMRRLLLGTRYPGWTSTIVVMTITSGMILFSIGVIGDYLIRIISGIERRPTYVLRESGADDTFEGRLG